LLIDRIWLDHYIKTQVSLKGMMLVASIIKEEWQGEPSETAARLTDND